MDQKTKASLEIKMPGGLLLLGLVFLVLKLTGQIAWSWIWVLAPFWLPLGLIMLFLLAIAFAVVIKGLPRRRRL